MFLTVNPSICSYVTSPKSFTSQPKKKKTFNDVSTELDRWQKSNTPRYQTVPTLTHVFTGNYLLLHSYLGWATSQGLFHLGISFRCWVKGMRVTFYVFWSLFSYYQACWSTRRLWIRSPHSWRRWWSRRHEVRMLLMPILPDMGLISSTAKVSGFLYQLLDWRNATVWQMEDFYDQE